MSNSTTFRDSMGYQLTPRNRNSSLKAKPDLVFTSSLGDDSSSLNTTFSTLALKYPLLKSYPQRPFERKPFSSITAPLPYNLRNITASPNSYNNPLSRNFGANIPTDQDKQQNQVVKRSQTPGLPLDNNNNSSTALDQDFSARLLYSPAMNVLCLTTISEVNPHLYLSGASAINEYKLRAKGITFVVNVTADFPNVRASGVECMAIRLEDTPSSQLMPYFDTVADKIREVAAAPGKTLVHCMVGASRSATLVIAYLMKHRKMTLLQSYHYLKRIRPVIRPNPGFFRQLVTYEYKLFGRNTVKMLYVPITRTFLPDVYCEEY